MSDLNLTYSFVAGTTASASAVQTDFNDVKTYINNRNQGTTSWDFVTSAGTITGPAGSATAVSFGVGGATNGMYRSATNTVAFATNGIQRLTIDSNGDVNCVNSTFRVVGVNTATFPDYSRIDDTNTGLRLTGSDTLALTCGATDIFTASTNGVVLTGTLTNDSAAAGKVGERIVSTQTIINLPGTNGAFGDLASVSLTAGDWDVTGIVDFSGNGATATGYQLGISSTSGNSTTGLNRGDNRAQIAFGSTSTVITDVSLCIPAYRVSISSTTTHYLKVLGNFSAGTPQAAGRISARRVR